MANLNQVRHWHSHGEVGGAVGAGVSQQLCGICNQSTAGWANLGTAESLRQQAHRVQRCSGRISQRLQEQSSKTLQAPAFTGSITSGATTLCVLFALPKVQANQALLMQRLQMLRASSPPNTSGVQVGPAAVVRFQVKAQGSEDLTAGLGYQQQ